MTETPNPPQPQTAPAPQPPLHKVSRPDKIIIRPWPKIIFLYPSFLTALVLWFVSFLATGTRESVPGLGNAFMLIFCVNLLVFGFDFSRIKSITIVLGIVAAVAIIAWLNTKWEVVASLKSVVEMIDLRMNTQFFGFFACFFALMFLLVLINSRFNYYEINHLEVLHHTGYLGDIKRLPTTGLQFDKEIYDMLEYLLLRSGRLVLYPTGMRQAIVIDNVLGVNKAEDCIKDLLSVMAVKIEE